MVNAPYLCRSATRGGVGNCPGRLLPRTELGLLKDLNEHREDVGVDHVLTREETRSVAAALQTTRCAQVTLPLPESELGFLL